jgi:hypothetical protein
MAVPGCLPGQRWLTAAVPPGSLRCSPMPVQPRPWRRTKDRPSGCRGILRGEAGLGGEKMPDGR